MRSMRSRMIGSNDAGAGRRRPRSICARNEPAASCRSVDHHDEGAAGVDLDQAGAGERDETAHGLARHAVAAGDVLDKGEPGKISSVTTPCGSQRSTRRAAVSFPGSAGELLSSACSRRSADRGSWRSGRLPHRRNWLPPYHWYMKRRRKPKWRPRWRRRARPVGPGGGPAADVQRQQC